MYAWIGLLFCIYVSHVDVPSSVELQLLWFLTVIVFVHFRISFFLFFLLGDAKLERFCMLPKTSRLHLPLGISLRVFDRSYFSHGSLALQLQCSICDYFTLLGGERGKKLITRLDYLPTY